jgi:hypothetical protein
VTEVIDSASIKYFRNVALAVTCTPQWCDFEHGCGNRMPEKQRMSADDEKFVRDSAT